MKQAKRKSKPVWEICNRVLALAREGRLPKLITMRGRSFIVKKVVAGHCAKCQVRIIELYII